ncbi:MAG: ketoacyl-ACP synthase III [bacterium]|nr:ketoacyl-ACP synthase III [bacterium]
MQNKKYIFPEYKKRNIKQHSKIIATASYFPDRVVSNQDIIAANQLPVTDVVIRKTLGVEHRRIADEGVADSDLLVKAAQRCLEKAKIKPEQLSKLLVTKFLGDRILPMTASMVQRKLNSQVAFHAVDIEGGINSFLHAIDLATRYISTTQGKEQYILILSGGIHVTPISKTDPRLAFLFGDGASAILLAVADEPHFLASYIYTNYEYYDTAGSRMLKMDEWVSEKIYDKGEYELLYNLYRMDNWKESLDFYLQAAEVTRENLLQESGLTMKDIDLVLVTENNKKIRDLTLEKLGVPEEKSLTVIHEYGNTMSAMLPILMNQAFSEGRLKQGMNIMLISHGEGASGGGMIYRV